MFKIQMRDDQSGWTDDLSLLGYTDADKRWPTQVDAMLVIDDLNKACGYDLQMCVVPV